MANQDEQLRLGIEAARRGDRQAAEMLLRQVVANDPDNELAWMWLASSVDDVAERRRCLENALRINPNNTRAQEALRRLGGGSSSASAERGRRVVNRLRQQQPATRQTRASGPSTGFIIVGAIALVGVIALVVFGLVFAQQNNILNPPTAVNPEEAAAAAFNPSPTPSPDPASFTDTPTPFRVIVTRDLTANALPPTFTPTFTPTATVTLTPSATPYPISGFEMLLTSLEPDATEGDLYQMQADGSGIEQLGSNVRDVVYDPSGERVAFVRDVTNDDGDPASELFVAPVDNPGNAQQLTTLGSTVSSPTWASDGIQLAFSSDFDGDDEIWVITEDGNNLRQLTENDGVIDRDPAWSPDGSQIIFASDRESPGLTKLFSMDPLNPAEPVRLGVSGGSSFAPRWSLDGTRITYINDESGDSDVYTMNADGTNPNLVTVDDGQAEDRSPAFSPDGNWIGFISNRQDDHFQSYMIDIRGVGLQRITNTARDDQSLDFYPDLSLRLLQN